MDSNHIGKIVFEVMTSLIIPNYKLYTCSSLMISVPRQHKIFCPSVLAAVVMPKTAQYCHTAIAYSIE